MTNEEAIGEMYYLTHKTDDKKALDALDMAIKALEDKGYEQGYADGFADCLEANT